MKTKWFKAEELIDEIEGNIYSATTVLDIGCGIMPQRYMKPLIHVCCEPCTEYVQKLQENLKNKHDRNYLFLNASWQDVIRLFPPRSVDTVFLLDVIEHLNKSEVKKLIKKTERIARKQVIIFTTLGFVPQHHEDGRDAWGLSGGKWQEHKSGWYPEDFDQTWKTFASRRYHYVDNLGKPFKKPYGALGAIKNIDPGNSPYNVALDNIYFKAIGSHSLIAIRIATTFLKLWKKGKEIIWIFAKYVAEKKDES